MPLGALDFAAGILAVAVPDRDVRAGKGTVADAFWAAAGPEDRRMNFAATTAIAAKDGMRKVNIETTMLTRHGF